MIVVWICGLKQYTDSPPYPMFDWKEKEGKKDDRILLRLLKLHRLQTIVRQNTRPFSKPIYESASPP